MINGLISDHRLTFGMVRRGTRPWPFLPHRQKLPGLIESPQEPLTPAGALITYSGADRRALSSAFAQQMETVPLHS